MINMFPKKKPGCCAAFLIRFQTKRKQLLSALRLHIALKRGDKVQVIHEPPGSSGLQYYALGALRSNGEALLSHRTARSDELTGLVSLAVNTAFAVGCRADGTVVSPAFALDGWENILAVSASGTAVLGLASDGTVRSFAFRASDLPDTSGLSDVCAIAAGGTHFAFVHTDGSVTVRGENGCGQTDTQNWKLF